MKKANNMNKARLARPVSQRLLHAGMAELEGHALPPPFQILADLLTLSQSWRSNYAPHFTARRPSPTKFSDLPPSLAQGHHLKNCRGLDSPRCSFNREKSMYLSMIIAWFVVALFFKMPKKAGNARWRLRARAILNVCPAWCLQNSRGSGRHLLKLLLLGHWKSSKSRRS